MLCQSETGSRNYMLSRLALLCCGMTGLANCPSELQHSTDYSWVLFLWLWCAAQCWQKLVKLANFGETTQIRRMKSLMIYRGLQLLQHQLQMWCDHSQEQCRWSRVQECSVGTHCTSPADSAWLQVSCAGAHDLGLRSWPTHIIVLTCDDPSRTLFLISVTHYVRASHHVQSNVFGK